MKFLFAAIFSIGISCGIARAVPLGDSKIREIVSSAIPSFSITSGDRGWSGGVSGNADMDSSMFNANSAFFIVMPKEGDGDMTARQMAERIREYIVEEFHFPTTAPSSAWMKQQPPGTTEETFGEAFLQTYPRDNDRTKATMYLTIQVVRLDGRKFGVTTTYVSRGEQ
jgi:hypothetical protein